VLEPLRDLKVMVGETAKFRTRISAKPPPKIEWSNELEASLEKKDNCLASYENDQLELAIRNVQIRDEGVYRATVRNPLGEVATEARLTVLKQPAIKYDSRFDKCIEVVALEQSVNITCEVSGYPRPTVTWIKDGSAPVTANGRAKAEFGEKFANLNVKKAEKSEGGQYTVVAENEVGRAEATFKVKILSVPTPPINVQVADISSYSCKLTWQKPEDDGNSPITGYVIESQDLKRGTWSRVDRTSLTDHYIDKLDKGQSYLFRVTAENKVGPSEPAAMREPAVARGKYDVPSAPTILDLTDTTDSSCRVVWAPSRNDGGAPIRGYFVERCSGSKWIRVNKEPLDALSLVVTDLVQGSDYQFRVNAVNIEGEGPFSVDSNPHNIRSKYTRPDPPVDLMVADITRSSCHLTWRAPARTGGLPIVRYVVERRVRGEYKYVRFTDDYISECEYQVSFLGLKNRRLVLFCLANYAQ